MFSFFESVARTYHYEPKSEDEAARSGNQAEVGERPQDPETARGSGAATEDTSAGVGLGEPTGNSSSAETGLGSLPEEGTEEIKGV